MSFSCSENTRAEGLVLTGLPDRLCLHFPSRLPSEGPSHVSHLVLQAPGPGFCIEKGCSGWVVEECEQSMHDGRRLGHKKNGSCRFRNKPNTEGQMLPDDTRLTSLPFGTIQWSQEASGKSREVIAGRVWSMSIDLKQMAESVL